jgi:hypothetical protein
MRRSYCGERDQVKRLIDKFFKDSADLVQDLVHRPMDNKYVSVVVTAACN